ncbi:hypothetical protein GCM10022288_15630 [Gryllotalpicola kribbensis]|uniref:Prepilin-type N-terminal cleavage/methylation domain-containing protein n=1 Tax=Gryllotalpicola kribbensis TaxID=993084 RepID=A0ABP8ARK2_9MICO
MTVAPEVSSLGFSGGGHGPNARFSPHQKAAATLMTTAPIRTRRATLFDDAGIEVSIPNIIVAVSVSIAVIAAVVLGIVWIVPWSEDNNARSEASTIQQAEQLYFANMNSFTDRAGLTSAATSGIDPTLKLKALADSSSENYAIAASSSGYCLGIKSRTGKLFWATSETQTITQAAVAPAYASPVPTCPDPATFGATASAPTGTPSSTPSSTSSPTASPDTSTHVSTWTQLAAALQNSAVQKITLDANITQTTNDSFTLTSSKAINLNGHSFKIAPTTGVPTYQMPPPNSPGLVFTNSAATVDAGSATSIPPTFSATTSIALGADTTASNGFQTNGPSGTAVDIQVGTRALTVQNVVVVIPNTTITFH